MTREEITQASKRCGLMCTTFGCINILLFEDEKDSNYKVWACMHEEKYTVLRGPAYALPDGTDTHASVPTISTATSSPGEVATCIYISIPHLYIMKVNGVRRMVRIPLMDQAIHAGQVCPVVLAVYLVIICLDVLRVLAG